MKLVARISEISRLKEFYKSGKPEFVALYDRRRVGKTFLVANYYKNSFAFDTSGSRLKVFAVGPILLW